MYAVIHSFIAVEYAFRRFDSIAVQRAQYRFVGGGVAKRHISIIKLNGNETVYEMRSGAATECNHRPTSERVRHCGRQPAASAANAVSCARSLDVDASIYLSPSKQKSKRKKRAFSRGSLSNRTQKLPPTSTQLCERVFAH